MIWLRTGHRKSNGSTRNDDGFNQTNCIKHYQTVKHYVDKQNDDNNNKPCETIPYQTVTLKTRKNNGS